MREKGFFEGMNEILKIRRKNLMGKSEGTKMRG